MRGLSRAIICAMKRFLKSLALQIAVFCFFAPTFGSLFTQNSTFFDKQNKTKTAYAENAREYARVLNENTPFYSDPSCKILKFYLPYSYFVRIIKTGTEATRVIYMENALAPAREGYVKTADLYVCDYVPESPYPQLKLTLKNDEILFSSPADGDALVVLTAGDYAYYYGETQIDGDLFYYVFSGVYVGYVRKDAFYAHSLALHPKELPKEEEPDQSELGQSSEDEKQSEQQSSLDNGDGNALLSAVIIIAISLITISVIYALFRPEHKTFKRAAASDDDYD